MWRISRHCSIFTVEITSRSNIIRHWKPGSTGRPFRPDIGLLSSAYPKSQLSRLKPRTFNLAHGHLTYRPLSQQRMLLMPDFNESMIMRNPSSIACGGILVRSHNHWSSIHTGYNTVINRIQIYWAQCFFYNFHPEMLLGIGDLYSFAQVVLS